MTDSAAYGVIANDSSLNTYQVESLITITAQFVAADGVTPAEPTAVALYIKAPDGTETPYTGDALGNPATGLYTIQIVVMQVGPWVYKWQGISTVVVTSPDIYFQVAPTVFLGDFVTPGPPPPFTPTSLFAGGHNGAWFSPSQASTLFSNTGGTIPARLYESVKFVQDLSGNGRNAVMPAATTGISAYTSRSSLRSGVPYVMQSLMPTANHLTCSFGGSLGSTCTIVFANMSTVEFRTGQTVGSTYAIPKSFFAFLVIDRALTDAETASLTAYFSQFCPAYNTGYNFYGSTAGNDANDGLTPTTPKTVGGAVAQLLAGANGAKLAIIGGGSAPVTIDTGTGTIPKTQSIYFLAPTIFDKGEVPNVGTSSAWAVDANGYTLNVFCEGNLLVQNYGNNAYGAASTTGGTINWYDPIATTTYDGLTSHFGTTMNAYGATMYGCPKDCYAHVGSVSTYHEDCTFYTVTGAVNGTGYPGDPTCKFDFFNCTHLPDPATAATDWSAFWISCPTGTTALTPRSYRSTRFGAPDLTPVGTTLQYRPLNQTAFSACYTNGLVLMSQVGTTTLSFTGCFGPAFTVRPRFTAAAVVNLTHNAFKGPARDGDIIRCDFFSSPTDVMGSGIIQNNILDGASVALFVAVTGVSTFNANWTVNHNSYFSNGTNISAGVNTANDVTGDPHFENATTDMQADWFVTPASNCVGAGTGGSNIGVGVGA